MAEHPVFQLKTPDEFHKSNSIILMKPVYTRKIMHQVAKAENADYFQETEQ